MWTVTIYKVGSRIYAAVSKLVDITSTLACIGLVCARNAVGCAALCSSVERYNYKVAPLLLLELSNQALGELKVVDIAHRGVGGEGAEAISQTVALYNCNLTTILNTGIGNTCTIECVRIVDDRPVMPKSRAWLFATARKSNPASTKCAA